MDLHYSINCAGKLIDLSKPIVMGILNVTPDSFYDGGKNDSAIKAAKTALEMYNHGATIIDVGGMSSRPGATEVTIQEEIDRVIPVIETIHKENPEIIISIDTYRSIVAKEAVEAGAAIVNDISGGELDKDMFKTVANLNVPYILMHMQGKPNTMQLEPQYNDVLLDVTAYFDKKIKQLEALGTNDIILDIGFGFGKTIEHNYTLLKNLDYFELLNKPILVGTSRKSMIYKVLDCEPKDALTGTITTNALALQKGANILRVHDVKETIETIKIFNQYNTAQ